MSSSKFFGNPNDPKAKQQSTLAFKTPKESTNAKEEVDDVEDVQPRKKRTILGTVKDKDNKGDVEMEDEPEATTTANEKSPVDSYGSKVGAKGMTCVPIMIMHLPLV